MHTLRSEYLQQYVKCEIHTINYVHNYNYFYNEILHLLKNILLLLLLIS